MLNLALGSGITKDGEISLLLCNAIMNEWNEITLSLFFTFIWFEQMALASGYKDSIEIL